MTRKPGIRDVLLGYRDGTHSEADVIAEVDKVLANNPDDANSVLQDLTDVTGSDDVSLRSLVRSRVERTVAQTDASALGRHNAAPGTGADGTGAPNPNPATGQTPSQAAGFASATTGGSATPLPRLDASGGIVPNTTDNSARASQIAQPGAVSAAASEEATRVIPRSTGVKQVGDRIGPVTNAGLQRFVLEAKVGDGGMSSVFKAKDTAAYGEPTVAIKILSPQFSQHPNAFVAIQRETAKSRQLIKCPNIISVYDGGIDGAHAYMWMDFIEGTALDHLLVERHAPLPPDEALLIIRGMANGLSFAHAQNIIHADFKPGNVMLTQNPVTDASQVKIIDFGISRAFQRDDGENTIFDPGLLKAFTPAYASPEMLEQLDPDPRDDVYALACISYEILTGEHPFDRTRATEARFQKMRVNNHDALSGAQFKALRRALAFDRAARTPSVDQFLADLLPADAARGAQTVRWFKPAVALAALTGVAVALWSMFSGTGAPSVGDVFSDCMVGCPAMKVLPADRFTQGGSRAPALANEGPAHEVVFARPFALGVSEVTVDEYQRFVEDTGRASNGCVVYTADGWQFDSAANWQRPGFQQTGDHPVTCVSWDDATAYAGWLSRRSNRVYRLPSASELEFVARGISVADAGGSLCGTANVADQTAVNAYAGWQGADCQDGHVHTAPVGTFRASPHGLNDVLGNVFEWAADCWNDSYRGAPMDGSAWTAGMCDLRVTRGGSWFTRPDLVRPGFRNRLASDGRVSTVGFRVARDVTEEATQ